MRSFAAFSDHDFEFFVADLLGEIEGTRYEVFARGADKGIDLRRFSNTGSPDVVQCKRYVDSTFSHLKAAAKREAAVIGSFRPRVSSYRLVTTLSLTIANKAELAEILSDHVAGPQDILGAEDLETMLDQNEHVERRHPKLWLAGGVQLQTILNNGTYQRSTQLLEETKNMLPRYVETRAFYAARERLYKDRVLIIAGSPGLGKTTLARMLLADAALEGYELISISADAQEAFDVLRPSKRQSFYYDDFLGTTFLQHPLLKNEDGRIAQLVRTVANSDTSLFLMTTREYILKQALDTYELLTREGVDARRFLLELSDYTQLDRARIFYNHIWSSGQLNRRAKDSLLNGRAYELILRHHNYNPRLIEHITGCGSHQLSDSDLDDYLSFALEVLDDPTQIWRHAFEHQLDAAQRGLLIVLATMQSQVLISDLESAFRSYATASKIEMQGRLFARTLKVLDDSFISIYHEGGNTLIKLANPSIVDFVSQWLQEAPDEICQALNGAAFFPQVEWIKYSVLGYLAENAPDFLLESFAAAIERLLDTPETRWHMSPPPGPPSLVRVRLDRAQRLAFVTHVVNHDQQMHLRLDKWLHTEISRESASWEGEAKYEVDLRSVIMLFHELRRANRACDGLASQLKACVNVRGDLTSDWEDVLELRAVDPEFYTPAEWTALQGRFAGFLDDAIKAGGNYFRNLQEVSEIEHLATKMEIKLEPGQMRLLRLRVANEIRHEQEFSEEAAGNIVEETDFVEEMNESVQVKALFDHLAESYPDRPIE